MDETRDVEFTAEVIVFHRYSRAGRERRDIGPDDTRMIAREHRIDPSAAAMTRCKTTGWHGGDLRMDSLG